MMVLALVVKAAAMTMKEAVATLRTTTTIYLKLIWCVEEELHDSVLRELNIYSFCMKI